MTTEPDEHLDEKLRDAYAVDETAAARMAREVLTSRPRRPSRAPVRASLALATVALCTGLAVWLSRPAIAPAPAGSAPVATSQLSGSIVDGVLIVPIPDDVIVIAGPDRRDDRPPDGSGIVLVEGEGR